jgi:hypothetical protein
MKENQHLRDVIAGEINRRQVREVEDAHEGGWVADRSDFLSYEEYFAMDLGQLGVREHLLSVPNPTVVDLMSPTNALSDLFDSLPQVDKLGISVSTLNYQRSPQQELEDESKRVYPVCGDLLTPEAWKEMDEKLNGRPIDFLVERALSGIIFLPLDRDIYEIGSRLIWERVNPNGGIILAQIPSAFQFAGINVNLHGWINRLNKSGIDARYGGGNFPNTGKLLLKRFPDSPSSLPRF